MTDNLPTLYQNCMAMLHTEIGRKAWLWMAENRPTRCQYAADAYALEVERLVVALRPMLTAGQKVHDASDEVMSDLLAFMLLRHANWRLGGNVRPSFIVSEAGR